MPRATPARKNAGIVTALQSTLTIGDDGGSMDGYDGLDDLFAPLDSATETLNMCFFGREGSGKTTAIARAADIAPEGSKVLVINAEGGLKKKALQRLGIDTSKIVIWPNPDKGEEVTRKGLEVVYQRVKSDLAKDRNSWFLVAWDSITEIHTAIVGHVSDHRVDIAKKRGVEVDEFDEFFTDRSDYGTMTKMVGDLLRKFRDLPVHFVVTALERRDVDEKTMVAQYGPAITPGLQTAVLGYSDLNLYFKQEDEDGPYRVLVKGIGAYRTKDRIGGLPKVIADPSIERILGYVDGTIDEATDGLQKLLPEVKTPKAKVSGKVRKTAADRAKDKAEASSQDTEANTEEETDSETAVTTEEEGN